MFLHLLIVSIAIHSCWSVALPGFECGSERQKTAGKSSFPFVAALFSDGDYFCTGVLISNKHVLTGAPCLKWASAEHITVRLGEYDLKTLDAGEKEFSVKTIKVHEQYKRITGENDIGILTLASAIPFSESISPICLPASDTYKESGIVAGWGRILEKSERSNELQEVDLVTTTPARCKEIYSVINLEKMLCAGVRRDGDKDACIGFAGAPLMNKNGDGRWTVIGISSSGNECNRRDFPGLYTHVYNHIDWINANTAA